MLPQRIEQRAKPSSWSNLDFAMKIFILRIHKFLILGALLLRWHLEAQVLAQSNATVLASDKFPQLTWKGLYVINRHGARYPLQKQPSTLTEKAIVAGDLTPLGQLQLYHVGQWIRERYGDNGMFDIYQSETSSLLSSQLKRTVVSANSLALGLWDWAARDPDSQQMLPNSTWPANVPVFSNDAVNDIIIRGYDKCPTYLNDLNQMFTSDPEWLFLQDSNSQLLMRLAQIPDFLAYVDNSTGKVPLSQVWNAYDDINVAKEECAISNTSQVCLDLPNPSIRNVLNDSEWAQLQQVANTAEHIKYGKALTGNRLAGPMWNDILNHIADDSTGAELMFYLYSAHYPTLLSMFAALGLDPIDPTTIPPYGSAIIIESYRDEQVGKNYVRMLFRSGAATSNDDIHVVPLMNATCDPAVHGNCPETAACLDEAVCPVGKFVYGALLSSDWCQACQNTKADVCLTTIIGHLESASNAETCDNPAKRTGASFLLGVVVGIVVAVVVSWMSARRRQRHRNQFQNQNPFPSQGVQQQPQYGTPSNPVSPAPTTTPPFVNGPPLPPMSKDSSSTSFLSSSISTGGEVDSSSSSFPTTSSTGNHQPDNKNDDVDSAGPDADVSDFLMQSGNDGLTKNFVT